MNDIPALAIEVRNNVNAFELKRSYWALFKAKQNIDRILETAEREYIKKVAEEKVVRGLPVKNKKIYKIK